MRKQIRSNVYETNSSSVHTLVISNDGREPSKFILDKDGYLHIDYGEFDSTYNLYTEQYDKLSYLITLCYYCTNMYNSEIRNTYQFKNIETAVKNYTGCTGIIIDGLQEPYIDHQSIPEYGDIGIIDIDNEDSIINFVFNSYVGLKTYRD